MSDDAWLRLSNILILLVILVPAAIGDYQKQKIPNSLTMSGWVLGPVLAFLFGGTEGLISSLYGLGFMLILLFPLWMVHWFGAADVKLLATVGALMGIGMAPKVLLGVLLTGGVMSTVILLYRRRLLEVLVSMMSHPMKALSLGGGNEEDGKLDSRGVILPYAIPIAFGTMLTILYMQL